MRSQLTALFIAAAALAGCTAVDEMTTSDPVRSPNFQPGYEVAAEPNDTVETIARRFNIPGSALVKANHLHPPYAIQPHQLLIIPPPAAYRVRDGDTVAGIAASLGVDEVALAGANGLRRPYQMRVGQVLKVPGGYGGDGAPVEQQEAVEYTAPALPPRTSISAQPLAPPPSMAQPAPAPQPQATPAAPVITAPVVSGGLQARPLPPPGPPAVALAPQSMSAQALQPPPHQATLSPQPTTIVPVAPAVTMPIASTPPPPSAAQAAPRPATNQQAGLIAPHFIKPVSGATAQGFGPDGNGQTNDGINIAAPAGTPVKAADSGTVIYTGNELAAFGNLVLIRHAGGWVTAYGHLASIGVQRGATVSQGQPIGTVGQTGSASAPQLHFEIRQGSKPVDPALYLTGAKG